MRILCVFALSSLLAWALVGSVLGATVGTLGMKGYAIAGVGQTAPTPNNIYPDFVVKGDVNYSYLLFGGGYSSGNWTSWPTQTYYLKFAYTTEADGQWLGFAVGAAGDVTGDGEDHRDVLIGDTRYLDIWDPDDAQGKAWLVHGIIYTSNRPTITLTAGGGFPYCEVTEISSDQAQNWFGCSMGWAGNMNLADQDDFIVGASLWEHATTI
ncbi:MAG: hypothetical protein JW759_10605 [Candidatus Coatesbacteria bacterium]|nr:hypothetical protein [Candidatus Coatesbacteria bacterium]